MKRPTIFRTVVLLAGVCAAFWQAPRIVELIDKVRGGMSPAAAIAGLTGRGAAPPQSEVSLDELRAALSGATAGAALPSAKPGGEVIVFSPNGAALTEAQRQALLQKANRLRPSGSGHTPDRISLPPGASSPPKPPTTIDDDQAEKPSEEKPEPKDSKESPRGALDTASSTPDDDLSMDMLIEGSSPESADEGETVGIHDELRVLLHEISPPAPDEVTRFRRASRIAWRNPSLPRGPHPAFIIGPPGSAAERVDP
jgi:hypothetical protein